MKNPQTIERLEDMSPLGSLTLHKQDDGDMCLKIIEYQDDIIKSIASCEFCAACLGGGGSANTWKKLNELFDAMVEDHLKGGCRNGSIS